MNEYTAEDFKNAMFAKHRYGSKAVRWEMNYRVPWHTATGDRFSDEQMAETGWRPIHEHNPHATDAPEEEVQDLRDRLNAMVKENICRRSEAAPITLDTLREAWEDAVGSTAVHVGDTIIQRDHLGESFSVFEAERDYPRPPLDIRVLRRAPQPEPWQALADEMEELYDGYSVRAAEAAQFLHERGVRVTGGDDA